MGIIYIITNDLNDKVYIGQTICTMNTRWRGHLNCARNRIPSGKIDNAIADLGEEHFEISMLDSAETQKELDILERFYIEEYDSINNGYNTQQGGKNYINKLEKHVWDIVYLYVVEEMSSVEIGKLYKCSYVTIINLLKNHGIEVRDHNTDLIIVETGDRFNNYYAVARWIIRNNYSKSQSVVAVSGMISRAVRDRYKVYGLHIMYTDEFMSNGIFEDRPRQTEERKDNCVQCGKPIPNKSGSGLCRSCAHVKSKGKTPKPSKEQILLEYKELGVKGMALKYGRTSSTICYWVKKASEK